jgi:ATP-dependent DNA ligase
MVVERFEGYVAKDESSAYEGGATRRWVKVKQKGGPSATSGGRGGSAWRRDQCA